MTSKLPVFPLIFEADGWLANPGIVKVNLVESAGIVSAVAQYTS